MKNNKLYWNTKLECYHEEKVDDKKKFLISGIAINSCTTRNGVKYVAEELEKSAHTLKGKPLLKDHENKIDCVIGKVKNAFFKNDAVQFEAEVMDTKAKEMIADGRLNNVSVGATFENMEMENDIEIIRGLEFLELSLVCVPADTNATFFIANSFEQAVEEKLKVDNEKDKSKINAKLINDIQKNVLHVKKFLLEQELKKIRAKRAVKQEEINIPTRKPSSIVMQVNAKRYQRD